MPNTPTPLPIVVMVVFLAGALGLGSLMLATGAGELFEALRSQGWPSVAGTIQTSAAHYSSSQAGAGGLRDRSASNETSVAAVTYSYAVQGRAYSGDRIRISRVASGDSSYAKADVETYGAGRSVRVFYDPAHPQRSLLEPGMHPSNSLLPLLGLVFMLASAGFLYMIRRSGFGKPVAA
jgi:hypothetical protein